jgi:hypothetical protein
MRFLLIISTCIFLLASCGDPIATRISESDANSHQVIVEEVLQTTQYTYLKVKENEKISWLALPKMEANVGETYYYSSGLEMVNFESKELNRKFDSVLFLETISKNKNDDQKATTNDVSTAKAHKGTVEKKTIKIEPAKECITIAELFTNLEKYSNQTVKIKAQVVKVNNDIMEKNWYHIQDGTENQGNFDLVATSKAKLNLNDIVILEGKVSLKKDFGYGYFYEVLMEDALVK